MKKRILLAGLISTLLVLIFALSVSAAAPLPQKPDLGVDFGAVQTIDGFVAPSEKFVNTDERVLLTYTENEETKYVTYPTYYVTKDTYTFDFDFSKLNAAQSIQFDNTSIVMLEIPHGITEVSNSYFFGNTKFTSCLSVQIPGTVTTYGKQMFLKNSIIKIVEFLDGENQVTFGDQMFGSNATGGDWGTTNVEYIRFPNNLVSIGNNTFGKSYADKTIIFGESFTTIGTAFFNESVPGDKDTLMYLPHVFFEKYSQEGQIFTNFFGGFNQWKPAKQKFIIFTDATQEEVEKFVEAGKKVQTGYIFDTNVKIVSADEYVYETHKPAGDKHLTIVYGYSSCDAFHYGNHQTVEEVNDHNCTTDDSCRCGKVIQAKSADSHNVIFQIVYESYTQNGTKIDGCLNEGCAKTETSVAPLFVTKGYSIKSDGCGITTDYETNSDALNAYIAYVEGKGGSFTFGVFVGNSTTFGDTFINANGTINNSYAFISPIKATEYSRIKCTVADFTADEATLTLVMGLYVIDNGEVSYIQHAGTYAGTVTADTTLDVVTITKIAELTEIELALPTPKAIPNKED